MDFCYIGFTAVGKKQVIYGTSANNHHLFCLPGFLQNFFYTVANHDALRLRCAGGQHHIDPTRQRLSTGEVCKGLPPNDYHSALGGLPKELPVGTDGYWLGATAADAPVIIYSNDCFHFAPQIAIGISKSKGWN